MKSDKHKLIKVDKRNLVKVNAEEFFTATFSPPHPAIGAHYKAENVSYAGSPGFESITPYMNTECIQISFFDTLQTGRYQFGKRDSQLCAFITIRPDIVLANEGGYLYFERNTKEGKINITFDLKFEHKGKSYSVEVGSASVKTPIKPT